jgi:hypothetical protein
MFSKKPRANDTVPRRRRIVEDDQEPSSTETSVSGSQFRRNQTLSSYRYSTPEESTRQKAHTLTVQRRRLGGILFIVAIATLALALLLWQLIAQVHITTSTKQLASTFESSRYEKAINEYLNLNPSQRLRFALNTEALTTFVSTELPEVENLSLSGIPGIAQSNVAITFRTPVAGWQINNKQYYVDTSGVVFENNYYDAPKVQIVDESGVTPEQGSAATVGTRLLGFLGKIVAQAGERGYSAVRAVLPAGTTRQVDVYFEGETTRVKFSIDRGAGEQMEDADRSLKYLKSKSISAQYIDVRVAGRAAYK